MYSAYYNRIWYDWRLSHLLGVSEQDFVDKPENISEVEFGDKIVQSLTADNKEIYTRHSSDGGENWTEWKHTGGHANSNVKQLTLNDKVFQVIKGTDNAIYIRHSPDWESPLTPLSKGGTGEKLTLSKGGTGEKLTGWGRVSGTVVGDFQVEAIADQLVLSIRGTDNKIHTRHATNGTSWSGWQTANVRAITGIQQEVVEDKLVQSYRGTDDKIYTRYSSDGKTWSTWETLPEAIARSDWRQEYFQQLADSSTHQLEPEDISEIEFGDKILQSRTAENKEVQTRHSTDGGKTWTDWKHTGGHANSNIKQLILNNKVYQVIKGTDNAVYIRHSPNWESLLTSLGKGGTGEKWTGWGKLSDAILGDFQADVKTTLIDNRLVISQQNYNDRVYTRTVDDKRWTNWEAAPVATTYEVHQEIIDDRLVQSYRGIDDKLYTPYSKDGLDWSDWTPIKEVQETSKWEQENVPDTKTDFEAIALEHLTNTEFNGKQIQTVADDRGYIYRRHSLDGGDTWTDWQYAHKAVQQLAAAENQSQQEERFQPLAEQWANARNAVNAAEAPVDGSRNLVDSLAATSEHIPMAESQVQDLESLLLEVEQQLVEAQKEADEINAKVLAEWEEQESIAPEYLQTVEEILERRGELNKQSQELQNQLTDTEKWVEQQTVALDTETEQVDKLRQKLIADGEALAEKIAVATGSELTELQTKQAQLQDALGLLDNKAVVLRQQQTAFSQKCTLLTAENEVILAEQRLLDAYLTSPDSDFEELQQQLADARAVLAEAQRLAEQVEASSQVLTAPLQEVQQDLLAQNDQHY